MSRFRWNASRVEIPGCVLLKEIAAGGSSTIHLGYQPRIGRRVAVKVLNPRHLAEEHLRSRFERECQALGLLDGHPNVVRIFDSGISRAGEPYLMMEYLPGGSLQDRLQVGPLPWEEVLAIGVKLAGALQSAHEAGILHRDIKPGNVLVGRVGEPKLADFGIARLRAGSGVTTESPCFTRCYGAPELWEGEPTPSSDIYSLGATLFALVSGHPPFRRSPDERPSDQVVEKRQRDEPIPELHGGLPVGLRAVVSRAMATRPQDRFGSAAEFGEALGAVQLDHELAVTPLTVVPAGWVPPDLPPLAARPRPRRWVAPAGLVIVLGLAAGVVVAWPGTPCAQVQPNGQLSFGTLLPKTGQHIYQSPAMQAGVQLAIDDVNAAGGIPGIAVRFDPADQQDEGDPSADTVSRSADALLADDVDVIIGPGVSASAVKVMDKITCAGVIMFSPATTAELLSTYPDRGLYFRSAPSDALRKPALADLVVGDGNATVALMSRDDAYGNGLREATAQAIEDRGGAVIDSFSYDPDAPDFDREVQRVKAKNPDAIVLMGFNESALVLRALIDQGLGPREKRVYGNMSSTLVPLVSPQDPGVLAGMRGVVIYDGDGVFTSRLRQANPGLQDLAFSAGAYDAVVVTSLAAAVAGTDAPAAVAARINGVTRDGVKCTSCAECLRLVQAGADIDYDGVSGPLEFTDAGEPSSATYMITEIQSDGSLRTVSASGE